MTLIIALLALIAVELGVIVAYIVFTMAYSMYSVFVLDKRHKAQQEQVAAMYMQRMGAAPTGEVPIPPTARKGGNYA